MCKACQNKIELDTSATFYPFIMSKKSQSVFSVGATLDSEVDKVVLQKAVNDALKRFPSYATKLKKGYGKYHLVHNDAQARVFEWHENPIRPIDTKATNKFLFRVACGGKNISLDMFHGLSDANGAMLFLGVIIRRYRELEGRTFGEDFEISSCLEGVKDGEIEDSFKKYYKPISLAELDLKSVAGGAPFRVSGTYLGKDRMFFRGDAAAADIVCKAKEIGASVTGYLVGTLAYSLLAQEGVKKPVVIMVPVNLRKLFPSNTVQNFVTFVRVVVKKGEFESFEECVKVCAERLKEASSKQKMEEFISTAVRAQKSAIFRVVPLFVKWSFMRLGRLFLKSRQSIIISNLGAMSLPCELGVEKVRFNMNVSKNNMQNLGIVSYGGRCYMQFTSATDNAALPNTFFAKLEENNIKITNQEV